MGQQSVKVGAEMVAVVVVQILTEPPQQQCQFKLNKMKRNDSPLERKKERIGLIRFIYILCAIFTQWTPKLVMRQIESQFQFRLAPFIEE